MTQTQLGIGTFLSRSSDIFETMRSYVDSDEHMAMAIAFWGAGACKALGISDLSMRPLRILLNATSGACNPSELEILLESASCVQVRNDPQLHAKVALCGKKTLVGSANASANGLGFEGEIASCWTEACLQIKDNAVSLASWIWFEALWEKAEKLDQDMINQARLAWRITRMTARLRKPLKGSDGITPSSVAELPMFIALSCEDSDYDTKEADHRAKAQDFDLSRIEFYQSWPKIPKQSLLLAYDFDKKTDRVTYDKSFRTFESNRTIQLKKGGRIYPVEVAHKEDWQAVGVAYLPKSMLKSLRTPIRSLIDVFIDERKQSKERMAFLDERTSFTSPTDWCIRLDEFLSACGKYAISLPHPFRGI